MKKQLMWAVGPDGDEPWHAISAKTARGAMTAYLNQYEGQRRYMDAIRVPEWDTLEKVTKPDWVRAGLGAACDACGGMTYTTWGGRVVGDKVFCEFCLPKPKPVME